MTFGFVRLVGVAAVLTALLAAPFAHAQQHLAVSAAQRETLGITTAAPEPMAVATGRSWHGQVTFAPDAEWMVIAQLPGTLSRWLAAPGQAVKRGEVLALLRSDAALDLQREYIAARTQLATDAASRQRDASLFSAGVIAEKRWQATRQRWQAQNALVSSLEQRLRLAGFDSADLRALQRTQQLRADYPLRAPADGVIAERLGTLGQRVEAMSPVLRLGDMSRRWLSVRVPAADLGGVHVGDAVIADSGVRGVVRQVSRVIDPHTQTAELQAAITAGEPVIGALVQVRRESSETGLRIPAEAVVQYGGHEVIFVADKDGFQVRSVTVRSAGAGHVVVLDNLAPGERVAVTGVAALKGQLQGLGAAQGEGS